VDGEAQSWPVPAPAPLYASLVLAWFGAASWRAAASLTNNFRQPGWSALEGHHGGRPPRALDLWITCCSYRPRHLRQSRRLETVRVGGQVLGGAPARKIILASKMLGMAMVRRKERRPRPLHHGGDRTATPEAALKDTAGSTLPAHRARIPLPPSRRKRLRTLDEHRERRQGAI